MMQRNQLANILFLDVETASLTESYDQLTPRMQGLWQKKAEALQRWESDKLSPAELYQHRAAIYAEFATAICISCGYLRFTGDDPHLRLKSSCGANEPEILTWLAGILERFMNRADRTLCAHNGKEFDFPFLGRRYLANGMPVPKALQVQGKKPWEVPFLDTMELWKFGDHKSFTSLDLLTATLGIPSPKDDVDGSMIGDLYWRDQDFDRIQAYCQNDVIAVVQIMLKYSGVSPVADGHIEIV